MNGKRIARIFAIIIFFASLIATIFIGVQNREKTETGKTWPNLPQEQNKNTSAQEYQEIVYTISDNERDLLPLIIATENGTAEEMALLLEEETQRGISGPNGDSILIIAAGSRNQSAKKIELLMKPEYNMNINVRNLLMETPLIRAVLRGNLEGVEKLLSYEGINVSAEMHGDYSAISLAEKTLKELKDNQYASEEEIAKFEEIVRLLVEANIR